jgi:hypothetical protein
MEILNNSLDQERLALKTEIEIAKQMDDIVRKIHILAKNFSIDQTDPKSPFRNVLGVATESSASIAVIKNYIRYQVGRSGSSPIWQVSKDNKLFATVVVENLDNLLQDAQEVLQRVRKSISKTNSLNSYLEDAQNREQLTQYIHLKMAQLYLGYLAREHTALVGELKFKKANNSRK